LQPGNPAIREFCYPIKAGSLPQSFRRASDSTVGIPELPFAPSYRPFELPEHPFLPPGRVFHHSRQPFEPSAHLFLEPELLFREPGQPFQQPEHQFRELAQASECFGQTKKPPKTHDFAHISSFLTSTAGYRLPTLNIYA
jgi:uncharacterized protein YozE (UPF0346 family)